MNKFILYKQLPLPNLKKYEVEISKIKSDVQDNEFNIVNQIISTDCSDPQFFNNKLESFGKQVYGKQNKNSKLSTYERENICKLISVNHNIQDKFSNLSEVIKDSISNKNNIWIYKPNESEKLNNYSYPWLHYFYEVLVYDDNLPSIPIDNSTVEPPRISLRNAPVEPPSLALTYTVDEIIDTLCKLYSKNKPHSAEDSSDSDEESKDEFLNPIEELLNKLRTQKDKIKLNESLKKDFESIKKDFESIKKDFESIKSNHITESFKLFLKNLLKTTKCN